MNTATASTRLPGSTGQRPEMLRVVGLTKHFPITEGLVFRREVARVHAVDDVSFAVHEGQTFGLVGESGCGKSTVARTILRLTEPTAGEVIFQGQDLRAADPHQMRATRRDMQVVFQDPFASLNPRLTVGQIIGEPLKTHDLDDSRSRIGELLEEVGLQAQHATRYPHEFSGGQRQRIAIARALSTRPSLVFCDEPTSALDVSIQAQILNLLADLQERFALSYVLVSHDLSVVRDVSDTVAVMYLGQLVEVAATDQLYEQPRHPYTVALLSAVPVPDPDVEDRRERILLTGHVPDATAPPPACRFHTRCWKADERCRTEQPPLVERSPSHWVACHYPEHGQLPLAQTR